MNEHPIKQPPLHTKDAVVKDIFENMSTDDKARLKHTAKEDLIMLHHGWGTYLRNYYQMWHNADLVKSTGKEHPDDASTVIIEEVWEILQRSDELGLEKPPEPPEIHKNIFFQWHEDKACLEIKTGSGTSIVMEDIDLAFAQAIAEGMKANLLQLQTSHMHPDVAPRSTHRTPNVMVTLRKYPRYREDGEVKRDVFVEWLVIEQRLDISCGGAILAIEHIDLDLAQAIAKAMKTGLPEVERYTANDVAPRITHSSPKSVITLWMYPQHPDNQTAETPPLRDNPIDEGPQKSGIKKVLDKIFNRS